MKRRIKIALGCAVVLVWTALFFQAPLPISNQKLVRPYGSLDSIWLGSLEAQVSPPAVPWSGGQLAITGMNSGTTGSLLAPQSVILASPGGTSAAQIASTNTLRNYVYEVDCLNTSSTQTVAILWDSGTTASATTPTVTQIGYVPCVASLAGATKTYFNPPLRLRLGSALGISTHVSVSTAFYFASGFQNR